VDGRHGIESMSQMFSPVTLFLRILRFGHRSNIWPSVKLAIYSAAGLVSGFDARQPPVLPAHFTSRFKLLFWQTTMI
jgi:hypothetical protein